MAWERFAEGPDRNVTVRAPDEIHR
jgi:hypothetical protein